MDDTTTAPLSGRKAQAARNDQRILDSARAVFLADPEAPIAAVAEHAGVGISALYRRYRSKEELLQRLAGDGLRDYLAAVEAALADEGEPWAAFATFMRRCLDAGTSSLTARLAGSFTATEEMNRDGRRSFELTQRLLDRTKAAGALRPEIEVGDLSLLFEQLQAVNAGEGAERRQQLRRRYLALVLAALRAPAAGEPLPGPPPTWAEISGRYNR
ncbi:MAG: TetR/AcrR family transcriptional regulator [Mycobacteriales bacterium]